jgi:hypothetical protein
VEDASPQETDTDAGADDGQQSLPQTTPLGPLEITPTLTPSPTLGISSPTIGLSPPPCPAGLCPTPMPTPVLPQSICIINPNHPACLQSNALENITTSVVPQSICIINPNHPDCPYKPLGRSVPQSICIINPSHPQCQPTTPTTPVPAPLAGPKTPGGPLTPRSLCIINPSLPECQPTTLPSTQFPHRPTGGVEQPPLFGRNVPEIPTTTLGSQSPTLDLTRALTPTPTPTPTPNSGNTGVGQARPESNTGDLFASPFSSELQTELPNTALTQRAPDALFSGPKSAPGGSVPLRDPALVSGPDEEGVASGEPCIAFPCFPYGYGLDQDEICRNGIDDDFDGKVDETIYCSEVPGESKPKPRTDDELVPIPGSPLGPPQN